jgi:predicted RNA-binding Zn ribbon-like protein
LDDGLYPHQLCLDFVNTISWRTSATPTEGFADFATLLKWCVRVGVLTESQAAALLERDGVLKGAIELREAGRRLLLGGGGQDADVLNRYLERGSLRVHRAGESWSWGWSGPTSAEDMLWPVAYSFASLLTSGLLERIHECEGEGCGWLFLDQSRNRSRKWCDMSDCGNRAKARRHYLKVSRVSKG